MFFLAKLAKNTLGYARVRDEFEQSATLGRSAPASVAAVRMAVSLTGRLALVIDSMSISIEKKLTKKENVRKTMLERRINLKKVAPLWNSLKKHLTLYENLKNVVHLENPWRYRQRVKD